MKMLSKVAMVGVFRGCVLLLILGTVAAAADDPCELPPALRNALSKSHPGARVVRLSDLSDSDRDFFRKDHGNTCPGLAQVDFYGDKKPTWAVVLIAGDGLKRKTELVVAHRAGATWEIRLLEGAGTDVPVVWRQDPGEYNDVCGDKKIQAKSEVVVLCGYESWAILYAWSGKEVEKIWISD